MRVTPEAEAGDRVLREHYFTRQRRKREDGEEYSNEKRRAEQAIRKRVKEQKKARELEGRVKRNEGEQRVVLEGSKQKTQEEEVSGEKEHSEACELRNEEADVDEVGVYECSESVSRT